MSYVVEDEIFKYYVLAKKDVGESVSTVLEYIGIVVLPDEVPTDVINEWESTLKAERQRIYNALISKIPSEDAFKERIADASSDVYETFVNPNYTKKDPDVIKMKQRVKLARKYADWRAGIDTAFAEGGTFETNVTAKKNKYQLARYTIAHVGHKPTQLWGPLAKAVLLLCGDPRPLKYLGANDSFSGEVGNYIKSAYVTYVRPMLIAKGTYAGVMAIFAHEGGLESLRDSIINKVNTEFDEILTAFAESGYAPDLALEYDAVADQFKWHAKVETTT